MVDKMIQENKLESEQEVHLYLQILKLQNKSKEALDFLNSSICTKLYPGAPIYMKINLLKELKMWRDCNILLKELLNEEWVHIIIIIISYNCFFKFQEFHPFKNFVTVDMIVGISIRII